MHLLVFPLFLFSCLYKSSIVDKSRAMATHCLCVIFVPYALTHFFFFKSWILLLGVFKYEIACTVCAELYTVYGWWIDTLWRAHVSNLEKVLDISCFHDHVTSCVWWVALNQSASSLQGLSWMNHHNPLIYSSSCNRLCCHTQNKWQTHQCCWMMSYYCCHIIGFNGWLYSLHVLCTWVHIM